MAGRRTPNAVSSRWRALSLLLVGLLAGTLLLPPVSAHISGSVTHTKNHMKKFFWLKKAANKRFVSSKTYQTFSETLDADGAEVDLVTTGPLRYFARCLIDDAGVDRIQILATSSVGPWWEERNETASRAADATVLAFSEFASTGSSRFDTDPDDHAMAVVQGGTIHSMGIAGATMSLGLNVFGHKCLVAGAAFMQRGQNSI